LNPANPPVELLTYKRDFEGAKILKASIDQMLSLGTSDSHFGACATATTRIFLAVKCVATT
jgi:hypothetical protein